MEVCPWVCFSSIPDTWYFPNTEKAKRILHPDSSRNLHFQVTRTRPASWFRCASTVTHARPFFRLTIKAVSLLFVFWINKKFASLSRSLSRVSILNGLIWKIKRHLSFYTVIIIMLVICFIFFRFADCCIAHFIYISLELWCKVTSLQIVNNQPDPLASFM